jgi:glycine betaine/proline transport system substrate-binding protein
MTTALGKAIRQHREIVVTGWSPHWMFQKYHLKYLKDPSGTMGKAEHVSTMARKGLKRDMPKAYRILDRFHWTTDEISSVMLDIQNGMAPEKAARKWIKAHPDQVAQWTR